MKNRILAYLQDDFLRHNVIFFIGSMAVAVLNYAYHPIISRLLSVDEFGEVQAYFSLIAQLGIITSVFGRIILNIKTNTTEDESSEETVNQLYTLSTLITVSIILVLLIGAPYIGVLFNLPGYIGLILTALILLISIPQTFAKFHLQAEKRFTQVSITELLVSIGKIVFAIIFILVGTKVAGALAGLLASVIVGLVYVYPYTKQVIHHKHLVRLHLSPVIWKELHYGTLILFATGFATFLFTADILVVRYFFDSETAGLYAGIATVARIIVFATASVAGVTIAHIKMKNTHVENHAIMRKAIILVSGMAGALLLIFFLLPSFIMQILMGERFLPIANLLPLLSVLMVIVALTNLFIMYFLALRRFILIPVTLFGSCFIAIMIFMWHNQVQDIISVLICGVGLVFITLVFLYYFEPKKSSLQLVTN